MTNKERPGFGKWLSLEEIAWNVTRDLEKIVQNYIESESEPQELHAMRLVNIIRASGLFPKTTTRKEIVDALSVLLPEYGYTDTVFKRRYFLKMPSRGVH